ncbi:MAG TPA: hypothetical protein VK982_12045 [Bacteroidales bacterium]|nr:hypothetical protein [Bacteroidales bacterium]
MLVKTNKKLNDGRDLYQNVLTGVTTTLHRHQFTPSQRKIKREKPALIKKVQTNRKSTRGRKIYYQLIYQIKNVFDGFENIFSKNGKLLKVVRKEKEKKVRIKTIKHYNNG